jgi:hypothetical protein
MLPLVLHDSGIGSAAVPKVGRVFFLHGGAARHKVDRTMLLAILHFCLFLSFGCGSFDVINKGVAIVTRYVTYYDLGDRHIIRS